MKQVEKSTGRAPPGLANAPELPDAAYPVWHLFTHLEVVTYTELDAYQRQTGDDLSPWEIDAIMSLNLIRRAEPKCPQNMLV